MNLPSRGDDPATWGWAWSVSHPAAALYDRARWLATTILGLQMVGIGIGFWIGGEEGMAPAGRSIFEAAKFAPWWAWATWATLAGLMILVPSVSPSLWTFGGLVVGASWLGTWGVILVIAVVNGLTAPYVAFLYSTLVSLWCLFAVMEYLSRQIMRETNSPRGH